MSSIQLPKDTEILKLLSEPHTRYDVMKRLKNHYSSTLVRLDRLEAMGYIFVQREVPWRGKKMKFYLITAKGMAILRGFREADSR